MKILKPTESKKKNLGLTLIELLFVLVLFIIVLSMTLPTLTAYRERRQVEVVNTKLSQALQYARLQSFLRAEPVILVPEEGQSNYNHGMLLYPLSAWEKGSVRLEPPLNKWVWNYPELHIEWKGSQANYPLFTPHLHDAMMNGSFLIEGKYLKRKIIMNRYGRIRAG